MSKKQRFSFTFFLIVTVMAFLATVLIGLRIFNQ